jgi:phosphatidylglycerophosphate synthase
MVTAALILVPESPHPLTLVGGLSLLKRALFMAQRTGAKTCYVFVERNPQDLQCSLQGEKRLTSTVIWITPDADRRPPTADHCPSSAADHCLLFQINTLFHPALVHGLNQKAVAGEVWSVEGRNGSPALLLFPAAQLSMVLTALAQGENPLANGTAARAEQEVKTFSLAGHFLYQITTPASVGQAEKALLLSLENPRDGLVDAYLNRKLSRPLTRLFVRTPLTPNQITLLSCLIGLTGAACFFPGGYLLPVLGALLLQLSVVVDCIDGEVARLKFMESPMGDWLDIVCDTIVHVAIFLGIGVAVWKQGETAYAPLLGGALVTGALLSFPLVTYAEKTEELGKKRGGWEDRLIQTMVSSLTNRDSSVIVLACALVRKLPWFLWGAAVGAQVFWLTLAGLLLRSGRLRGAKIFLRYPNT